MKRMLLIPSYIKDIFYAKDGSTTIKVETGELDNSSKMELGRLGGTYGYMAFKEETFTSNEQEVLAKFQAEKPKKQSKSQVLRSVLWKKYESNDE